MNDRAISMETRDEIIVASMKQVGLWGQYLKGAKANPGMGMLMTYKSKDQYFWVIQIAVGVEGDEGFIMTKIPAEMLDMPEGRQMVRILLTSMDVPEDALMQGPFKAEPPQN